MEVFDASPLPFGLLSDLLQWHATIPVVRVEDEVQVDCVCVYRSIVYPGACCCVMEEDGAG